MKHHKLVRNRVPGIIEKDRKFCRWRHVPDGQVATLLEEKAEEELAEFRTSQSPEELADLLEVLHAIAAAHKWDWSEIETLRAQKAAEYGGFSEQILLKGVRPVISRSEITPDLLLHYKSQLLAAISIRMVEKYRWIRNHFHQTSVTYDIEFQKRYAGFDRMRFVSLEYRQAYFELLDDGKQQGPSFEELARQIYSIDNRHEFSFLTKMLHTLDTNHPIYDSQVDVALGIHRRVLSDFELCLQQNRVILQAMMKAQQSLLQDPRVQAVLAAFTQTFTADDMSEAKKQIFCCGLLVGGKSNNSFWEFLISNFKALYITLFCITHSINQNERIK